MSDLSNIASTIPGTPGSTTGWGGIIPGGGGSGGSSSGSPLWQQLLLGGMLGTGEIGNILQGQKQSSYQDFLLNLMKNPALLSQMVLKAEQPISGAQTQAIEESVQGNLAQRGLSQAPGIFATTESQALAPLQQQNYQTALQQVLASLQAPAGTFQPAQNLSPLLALFLRSFGSKGAPPGPGASPQSASGPQLPPPIDIQSPGITYPTGQDTGITYDPSTGSQISSG